MSFLKPPAVRPSPLELSKWASGLKRKKGHSQGPEDTILSPPPPPPPPPPAPAPVEPIVNDGIKGKISMKKLFGVNVSRKDGSPGKPLDLPSLSPCHPLLTLTNPLTLR